MPPDPLVRVEEAGLGPDGPVRLVLSGVAEPDRLRAAWASSGAVLAQVGDRLHATTTVQALARAAGRALDREQAGRLDHQLRAAVAAWRGPAPAWVLPRAVVRCDERPVVMGVVNVTPDSFSDGGSLYPGGHPAAAIAHARRLVAEGADLVDVGGESTRPGAAPVDEAEELRRVLPVVEALAAGPVPVSIDTMKAGVARAAVAAGAQVVNDVSGGRHDALLDAAVESGAGYVLMHARGTPATMRSLATYDDVVAEVYEFLAEGLDRCARAGVAPERVVLDPGLGFAKTATHNLDLLRHLRQLRGLGRAVLVGASRKSFLGELLGGAAAEDRLEGSLAAAGTAIAAGASVLRVHDVAATVRVARVTRAVVTGATEWAPAVEART